MITASFSIGGIEKASPEVLWSRFGHVAGISEEEFFGYYGNTSVGYAIKIEDLQNLNEPIDPYAAYPSHTTSIVSIYCVDGERDSGTSMLRCGEFKNP
ncbi:MAG: hypothetical protein AB9860_07855 [Methanomassiliicoccales archaeon]